MYVVGRLAFFSFHSQKRLLFLILIGFVTNVAFAENVTLVADQWCPYNCVPNSSAPGLLIEIAEYSLKKGGHTVSYSLMPWARAIEESRAGNYAGVVGAISGEVPDFIYPSIALAKASSGLYVPNSSPWKYTGLQSLESISLGVIQDYSYSDALDEYIEKNKDNPTRIQISAGDFALKLNFDKLQAGRVDAILENEFVVEYYLQKHSLNEKIKSAGSVEDKNDIFVAFSPSDPNAKEYARLVSEGTSELLSNGKMDEIFAKYGLK